MKSLAVFVAALGLILGGANLSFTKAQGPGTQMTQIINRVGLGSDCPRCQALAAEMDLKGSAWVMQNRDAIAKRTISNAEKLGHRMGPVRRAGVRAMIRTSARRGR